MKSAAQTYLTDLQSSRIERILDATKQLIGDVGIDNLTMRDIAAASKVAERTLYNRFGTKDALVAIAVLNYFEKSIEIVTKHRDASTSLQSVIYGIELLANEMINAHSFTHALMAAYFKVDGAKEMPHVLTEAINDFWLSILERMKKEKVLRPWVSIPLLCNELTGHLLIIIFWFAQQTFQGKELVERLTFGIFSILLGASNKRQAKEIESVMAKLAGRLP